TCRWRRSKGLSQAFCHARESGHPTSAAFGKSWIPAYAGMTICGLGPAHKLINDAFFAGFVEFHRQLVAFDIAYPAIAELLMEHPIVAGVLRGAGVGGLHAPGLGFDQRRAG